jgi:hypothetical protein
VSFSFCKLTLFVEQPSFAQILEASNLELNTQQLKVAEKVARQLHEVEKKKLEEQKRKRNAEEDWLVFFEKINIFRMRGVRRKVDEQRSKLEDEEKSTFRANKDIYALFNDLQVISKEYNSALD